jgi:DNA-binding transcriptional LysR family regulator
VEVGRLSSFTAAAKSLDLTKASVSSRVQQLEKELNTQLFTRTTRSVTLTDAGYEIFRRAQDLLDQADDLQEFAESRLGEPQGLLHIAAPMILVKAFLGSWIIEFHKLNPKVRIDLTSTDHSPNFHKDKLDFAFRFGNQHETDWTVKTLFNYHLGLFASPGLIERLPPLTKIADLDHWPGVGYAVEGKVYPWIFQENGEIVERTPELKLRFDDFTQVKRAAIEGLGAVHMGCQPAEKDVMEGRLVPMLTEYWPPEDGCHLVYRNHTHATAKSRVFIEFVESKLGQIPENA